MEGSDVMIPALRQPFPKMSFKLRSVRVSALLMYLSSF